MSNVVFHPVSKGKCKIYDRVADSVITVKSVKKSSDTVYFLFPVQLRTGTHSYNRCDVQILALKGKLSFSIYERGIRSKPTKYTVKKHGLIVIKKGTPFTWTSLKPNTLVCASFTPGRGDSLVSVALAKAHIKYGADIPIHIEQKIADKYHVTFYD